MVKLDGSAEKDSTELSLEVDAETEVDDSGNPGHDQTGREWWSDPPEK